MAALISKLKKRYYVYISVLILALFGTTFVPMQREMNRQVVENYKLLAESKRQVVAELISGFTANARSLSSRTAIRDFILDYSRGIIGWEELQTATYPKYQDGVDIIENMVLAVRYVGDRPLVVYSNGVIDYDSYMRPFWGSTDVGYRFVVDGNDMRMVVYSPVLYRNALIAHDLIVVDISKQMRELAQDGFLVSVVESGSDMLHDIEPEHIYERHMIEGQAYVCVAKPISDTYTVLVCKSAGEVFASVSRVSLFSIAGFAIGLLIIFFVLHSTLARLANSTIRELGNSRDIYKKYANYDLLTGAYTRVFFENWVKGLQQSAQDGKLVVVMIDVDEFKQINDTCGHETGDHVLQYIVAALKGTLREKDFVIRFGGDEFIVVLDGIDVEKAHKIFDRVSHRLCESNPFPFAITISYGVSQVGSAQEVYEAIKQADRAMYQQKRDKKL
ncbi:MAG: hypothetical protein ABT01_06835 [Clostridium sp. SCN 57-10]|nr:MAG: hypothetical protein ABT01_06835 [Clostridium sp. SCN 57-10]